MTVSLKAYQAPGRQMKNSEISSIKRALSGGKPVAA